MFKRDDGHLMGFGATIMVSNVFVFLSSGRINFFSNRYHFFSRAIHSPDVGDDIIAYALEE